MQRWQYVTDTHGDLADPDAIGAALKFRDKFKPEVRIHGGDMFDFRALRGGASDEERAEGIAADIDAGLKFLRDYSPTHYILGNHDYRLIEKAKRCANGMLQEHCRLLVGKIEEACADIGCKLYPYDVVDGVMQYGNYKFVHGYVHNLHSAHKAASCFGNVIMGHVHTFQLAAPERDDNPSGWTCGHLADPAQMTYARRRQGFLRWKQGFMYGWKTDADALLVNMVKKEGDEWVYPTKFNR